MSRNGVRMRTKWLMAALTALTALTAGLLTASSFAVDGAGATSSSPPRVSSLYSNSGPSAGGQTVTVHGSGLSGVRHVFFGATPAHVARLGNGSALVVVAPRHTPGVVNVRVQTAQGTSPASVGDRYTYVSAPTVTSAAPTSLPTTGGTRVTVHGAHFTTGSRVLFGTAAGQAVHVVSAGLIGVTAPPHAGGYLHVQVVTVYGRSVASSRDVIAYRTPAPASITAHLGLTSGSTHAGQTVGFTLASSTVAAGHRFASGTLAFGDGSTARVSAISEAPQHSYGRAGVYSAVLSLVDEHGGVARAQTSVYVASSDALVYQPNVRRYPADAVTGVQSLAASGAQVVLAAGQPVPQPGQVMLVAAGGVAAQGLALTVQSANRNSDGTSTVVGHDAGMPAVYSTLRTASATTVGSHILVSTRGGTVAPHSVPSTAVPFSCHGPSLGNRPISVSADLSNTHIEPTIDLATRTFQLVVVSRPVFTLGATLSSSVSCSLGDYFALNIPIPSVPGLVVTINPYFTLNASGSISANFTWSPTFIVNITRSPSVRTTFLQMNSHADSSVSGSASLSLEGGVELSISLARAAGIQAELGPKITLSASISTANGGQACASGVSAIEATVTLFAHAFFFSASETVFHGEYYRSQLFSRCVPLTATAGSGGAVSGSGSALGGGSPSGGGPSGPSGPGSVAAANNNGQMQVQLTNFPLGTTYYFCHTGDPAGYPTGGTVTGKGHVTLTSYSATFQSGLCSGEGTSWIGLQATDGNSYYSNQIGLHYVSPTVSASNNNGQMALQLAGFPLGIAYFFCHTGDPSTYPTGGTVGNHGQFTVTAAAESFTTGLCSGSGNSWIGLQAADGHDYYSSQTTLAYTPPTINAGNNNGQMGVQLASFPLGTSYFFCHSGNPDAYPTGGVVTNHGQITVTDPNQYWASGLCSGRGNAWIGIQGSDGNSYYSSQTNLVAAQTPGAGVSVSNNNGQMAVQLSGFPLGTSYFFCHSGNPDAYPTGGVVTNHGQITVTDPNQYWTSGLCSGRGNAWIGIQAPDGADYYSNQTNLVAAQTAGASITASSSGGQIMLQVSNFPLGTTYFFCHTGAPSQYPTGGSVVNHGSFTVSSPNQTFGSLCGGSGNFWIGVQATDGADYYSNQVQQ